MALLERPEVDRVLSVTRSLGITLREWDRLSDTERDLRLEEWVRERTTCVDCGNPVEKCSDPTRAWYSYRRICWATVVREGAEAAYEALHKKRPWHDGTFTDWVKDRDADHPFYFTHGVKVGVAEVDVNPWDDFTKRVNQSPIEPAADAPVAEGAPADDPEPDS